MSDHNLQEELKLSSAEEDSTMPRLKVASAEHLIGGAEEQQVTDSSVLKTGEISRFSLGEQLGEGSFGLIYRATNDSLASNFALKIIKPEFYRSNADADRLLNALKGLEEIHDPHLASYYESGRTVDNSIYFVSDYFAGVSFADLIGRTSPFEPERFIDIFRQICQALKALHQRGIVHGNLKPSNIYLLEENNQVFVKLLDYGLAGIFCDEAREQFLRRACTANGANYFSPEQCLGYGLDARSDIYSIGLLMYESLTGKPLVQGQNQMQAVLKQLNYRASSMKEKGIVVPESIEKIMMKCLEKNRSERYNSIDDLSVDLDLAVSKLSLFDSLNEPELNPSRPEKTKGKKSGIEMGLSAIICAGVLTCIGVAIVNRMDEALRHQSHPHYSAFPRWVSHGPQVRYRNENPGGFDSFACRQRAEAAFSEVLASQNGMIASAAFQGAINPGLNSGSQYHLGRAAYWYGLAVTALKKEIGANPSFAQKEQLAELQNSFGEIYLRAPQYGGAGRLDRSEFNLPGIEMQSDGSLKLNPAYPGLMAGYEFQPNLKNADLLFAEAAVTLDNKFTSGQLDLLWNAAFTKFQLGKLSDALKVQKQISSILASESLTDRNALIMSHDASGRILLQLGHASEAVEEFKLARKIDREGFKTFGGKYRNHVSADLAYAFLLDGKYAEAEKLARKNLKTIARNQSSQGEIPFDLYSYDINMRTQITALKKMDKTREADSLELQYLRYLRENGGSVYFPNG
ncbi:MAG: serine/threonine protein kinase [Candidatus Obscuribacterales bacterium]|nr:serine/threonine protein kinase [Candidatus Obscuribacterales bacterium]